ncbi:MAG: flagellar basal body rod protein FlgC [Thermoleophilia bacterium]
MGIYPALGISATGLAAQRLRMDVIANNLANVDSTTGVGQAYRRKVVVMSEAPNGVQFRIPRPAGDTSAGAAGDLHGVDVQQIAEDGSDLRKVYDPGNPLADQQGYVTKPNVNPVTEMVDMVAASRSYQANVTAFEATKNMAKEALRLLK